MSYGQILDDASASEEAPPLTWSGKKSTKHRSVIPPDYGRQMQSPMLSGAVWILPWSIHNYPGLRRGLAQVLGKPDHPQKVYSLVRYWHNVRSPSGVPLWATERVRAWVYDQLEEGRKVLAELDAEIALKRANEEQRRNVGFCEVRNDGRDRRGNWRK